MLRLHFRQLDNIQERALIQMQSLALPQKILSLLSRILRVKGKKKYLYVTLSFSKNLLSDRISYTFPLKFQSYSSYLKPFDNIIIFIHILNWILRLKIRIFSYGTYTVFYLCLHLQIANNRQKRQEN